MDLPIYTFEEKECPTHGITKHMTYIQGHIDSSFGPQKDAPPPLHGIKELTCLTCMKEGKAPRIEIF